ncbi:MAG: PKD domain-containing protein [Thermoplasmata archaeon]
MTAPRDPPVRRRVVPWVGWVLVTLAVVVLGTASVLPASAASLPPPGVPHAGGASAGAGAALPCPSLPTLALIALPSVGTVPLSVHFFANVTGGCAPYAISWEFGDGAEAQGSAANVTHVYGSAGTFDVDVEARDANGTSAENSTTITVNGGSGGLAVAVSATVTQGPAPLSVTFWANVTGGTAGQGLTTAWSFDDDGNGSGSPIPYVFLEPGNYTIAVTVTSTTSGTATGAILIRVLASSTPSPPTLGLVATPSMAVAPANVTVQAYVNGSGEPFHLTLCFGDATPCASGGPYEADTGPVPFAHTYATAGNFTIVGTLANRTDASVAGATEGIQITSGDRLTVSVGSTASNGTAPFAVAFRAIVVGGTPPYSLQWSFGDGTAGGSVPNGTVTHTYFAPGTFLPTLAVHDSAGHQVLAPAPSVAVAAPAAPASGFLAPVLGSTTLIVVAILVLAAVGLGVIAGRRWKDRALDRRIRQEGEELVREMERPP